MNTELYFMDSPVFGYDIVLDVGPLKEMCWRDTEGWFCVEVRAD